MRTSFVFYDSWWEAIQNLPRDVQGDVLTAIIEYGLTGETTGQLKPIAKAMLAIAKTKKDVTLITNSAFIADYIRKHTAIKIILLGGEYQHESQVMVGPMMRKCAEAFFVDKLFIGTDGFSIDTGFTGNDDMRCEAVKDMARQASHVIIVTESDKFHQKEVSNLIDLHQVSCIYTDQGIPQEVEEYFKEKHIQVEKV